jgi:hypothetical protein
LPEIRFHDLRHTAASLMLNNGPSNCGFEKIGTRETKYYLGCVWTLDTEQTARSSREDGRIVNSDFGRVY